MICYKLQHIPTGLFYTPSKGRGNLSKTGKIYPKIPPFKWAETVRIDFWYDGKRKDKAKEAIRGCK